MGSGISLSEIQVTTIVKRDLGIDYQKIIDNRGCIIRSGKNAKVIWKMKNIILH